MTDTLEQTPVGYLMWVRTDRELPDTWVWLDKPTLRKADYPELYAVIGGAYGEDENTFSLPPTPLGEPERGGMRIAIKVKKG